jgi:hypothetical protein
MPKVTSCLLHTKKSPNWGMTRKVLTRMVPENLIFVLNFEGQTELFQAPHLCPAG